MVFHPLEVHGPQFLDPSPDLPGLELARSHVGVGSKIRQFDRFVGKLSSMLNDPNLFPSTVDWLGFSFSAITSPASEQTPEVKPKILHGRICPIFKFSGICW